MQLVGKTQRRNYTIERARKLCTPCMALGFLKTVRAEVAFYSRPACARSGNLKHSCGSNPKALYIDITCGGILKCNGRHPVKEKTSDPGRAQRQRPCRSPLTRECMCMGPHRVRVYMMPASPGRAAMNAPRSISTACSSLPPPPGPPPGLSSSLPAFSLASLIAWACCSTSSSLWRTQYL